MSGMFKDKKVLYALVGGAALLVGAAIISHISSQTELHFVAKPVAGDRFEQKRQ